LAGAHPERSRCSRLVSAVGRSVPRSGIETVCGEPSPGSGQLSSATHGFPSELGRSRSMPSMDPIIAAKVNDGLKHCATSFAYSAVEADTPQIRNAFLEASQNAI